MVGYVVRGLHCRSVATDQRGRHTTGGGGPTRASRRCQQMRRRGAFGAGEGHEREVRGRRVEIDGHRCSSASPDRTVSGVRMRTRKAPIHTRAGGDEGLVSATITLRRPLGKGEGCPRPASWSCAGRSSVPRTRVGDIAADRERHVHQRCNTTRPANPDDARRVRFARRCGAGRSLLAAWPACTRAAPPRWSGSLRTFRRVMLQGPLQAHIPSGTGLDAPRCRRRTCCRAFAGHG